MEQKESREVDVADSTAFLRTIYYTSEISRSFKLVRLQNKSFENAGINTNLTRGK